MKKLRNPLIIFAFAATAICGLSTIGFQKDISPIAAAAPSDYYAACEGLSGSSLQSKLLDINKPKSPSYDWSRYEVADEALDDSSSILCLYTRHNIPKGNHCGTYAWDKWNREHIWTQSAYPASAKDNHNIFACEGQINNYRGSMPFGEVAHTSSNQKDIFGHKTDCYWTNSYFEPCDEAKGEVARSVMYGTVMYSYTMTKEIKSIDLALKWHLEHPITERDTMRNDRVYGLQGNRNPFVDHKSYACKIWGNTNSTTKSLCDQYNGWTDGDDPTPTKELISIEVSGTPSKTSYTAGERFSTAGLTVTATYSEGNPENVTSEVSVSPDPLTKGTTSVKLSYTFQGVTKSADVSGITVSSGEARNYGTLENPLSVSEAKALVEEECTSSGSYTQQPIYCKGRVTEFLSEDSTNLRKKVIVKDLTGLSYMNVESLNMSDIGYKNLQVDDDIIFHGYGCNNNGTSQFKYTDTSNPTLDDICLKSLEIVNTTTDYFVGDPCHIGILALPAYATQNQITYTSNNNSVASVDSNGDVTFKVAGTAIITATSKSGHSDSITFTVKNAPVHVKSIEASLKSSTYYVDDSDTVVYSVNPSNADNKEVTFSSSDSSVANINSTTGVVNFLKQGSAVLTVTSKENTTIKTTINVAVLNKPVVDIPVESVTLRDCETNVKTGENTQLFATISPSNASNKTLTFSSNNTSVATVDSSTGLVHFVKEGTVTIMVSSNNNKTDSVTFTVSSKVVDVTEIDAVDSISLDKNESKEVEYTVLPENATDKSVTFSTSNPNIVSINPETNEIKGVSAGDTVVTITSNSNKDVYKEIRVSVKGTSPAIVDVTSIKVDSSKEISLDEEFTLSYEVLPANATNKGVTFSSSDDRTVTVDNNGKVKGVDYGTAKVTITSTFTPSVSATVDITVKRPVPPVQGTVVEIKIVNKPTKTVYNAGETFDPTGLVVESHMLDGSKDDITKDCTFDAPDMSTSGTKIITVNYKEAHSTTFTIVVILNKVSDLLIKKFPLKTHYFASESFNPLGLVIETEIDGEVKNVTDAVTFNYDFSVSGKVTAKLGGKTVQFDVVIETGNITTEHKAADFTYVFEDKIADVKVENVTKNDWNILEYNYKQLDANAQVVLKNLAGKSSSGEVKAAEDLSSRLSECVSKYDEIYLAHKADGFNDFMSRNPKEPTPPPSPINLPLLIGIGCGILAVIILVVLVVAISMKKKHA